MDSKSSSSSVSNPQKASNQDEIWMQQSLLFSETLKDLKSLRKQLYSAAQHFETSYSKEEQKQLVMESLKDYAIKALVNSIDHLGSVAYKVNSFIDEKMGEVSALELRFCCLQQCELLFVAGILESRNVPRVYQPRRTFSTVSDAKTLNTKSKYHRRSFSAEHNSELAVPATTRGTSPSIFRGHCRSESPQPGTFTFAKTSIRKKPDKKSASPQRFPFTRSGSLLPKRSMSPNDNHLRRNQSETQRSISLSKYAERRGANDIEQYSSKSKKLFKAMLSMRKSRKDQTLYKYLDEV